MNEWRVIHTSVFDGLYRILNSAENYWEFPNSSSRSYDGDWHFVIIQIMDGEICCFFDIYLIKEINFMTFTEERGLCNITQLRKLQPFLHRSEDDFISMGNEFKLPKITTIQSPFARIVNEPKRFPFQGS